MLTVLAIIILSYLLGSIPSAVIISRAFKGIDIREYGSKNAGFTNVYRVLGPLPAAIVLIIDIGKGIVAVLFLTQITLDPVALNPVSLKILAAISVILGHVFPIFAGFKGGKGIGTALGALFSLGIGRIHHHSCHYQVCLSWLTCGRQFYTSCLAVRKILSS
jgi:glycerol-3-phosphate acyltransferase PlsY